MAIYRCLSNSRDLGHQIAEAGPAAEAAKATHAKDPAMTLWLPDPDAQQGPCLGCASPVGGSRVPVLGCPGPGLGLVRYRWLLGHQATFQVWQWLAARLRAVARDGTDHVQVAAAADGYNAYSVLLLYSGSCTAAQYEASVRADMRRHNSAFSGAWAPDHQRLPAYYRAAIASCSPRVAAPLVQAAELNWQVHKAVADRLVPGGESLLRAARRPIGIPPIRAELDSYDAFFLVRRAPVCQELVTAQFRWRVAHILWDITANGPYPHDRQPFGNESHHEAIERLIAIGPQILTSVARHVLKPAKALR